MSPTPTDQWQSSGNPDPVEQTLASAVEQAVAEGQWALVAELSRELEARKLGRAGVVNLAAEREKRRGR